MATDSNEEIMPEDKGDHSRWRRPRDFPTHVDFEEKEAVMNDRPEFLDKPRCRGVTEWINCFLFDTLLLVIEAAINLWLATSLQSVGLVSEYRAIIVMLMLPSAVNPAIWMTIRKNYKISGLFIFALLIVGFPSPIFLYLWHLYLSAFASLRESETSKMMANSFRTIHACICSMPLMIINLSTLINQMRVDGLEDYVIDLKELRAHVGEVEMHGVAFLLSFINVARGLCLFNERETMTMLFSVIALPMTMITALCRILLLSIVIAFIEPEWTIILLLGLIFANNVLLWACRKRTKVVKGYIVEPTTSASLNADLNSPPHTCSEPGSQQCLTTCCCNTNAIQSLPTTKSGKYVLSRSPSETPATAARSCWNDMGNYTLVSLASIISPCGYANDEKMYHPRIKGGLYLMLNYMVNMSIMGVTLGYTVLHRVPNQIHGITISNPSIYVNVPSSKIDVETGGMDVSIKLPNQRINLASMPSVDASFNTESSDNLHAILLPVILAAICLPFTIMRAAMMELDCFVTRRKQLGQDFDDFLMMEECGKVRNNRRQVTTHGQIWSLRDILARNVQSKELKCRLYMTLICSIIGIMVMTSFIMLLGVLLFLNLQ